MIDEGEKIVVSDTDLLSSFLWRNQFGIVTRVFAELGMDIIIPKAVMEELEYSIRTREMLASPIHRLNDKKEKEHKKGEVFIRDIDPFSEIGVEYSRLKKTIGKGEAAALSMVIKGQEKTRCLASNNLKDIKRYTDDYGINLWTTADILYEAEIRNIASRDTISSLWDKMKKDGLYLPYDVYEDFLQTKGK